MRVLLALLPACSLTCASAAVVAVELPNPIRIEYLGGSGSFQPLDLDLDGQKDVEFVSAPFIAGLVTIGVNRTPSILFQGLGGAVVPVCAGELIGLTGQYAYGGTLHNSRENLNGMEQAPGFILNEFMIFEDGYIGVEFTRVTGIHYGWLRWRGGGGPWGRVFGWAWETEPGVPIIAGAVPEPGAGVLGAAALTLLLMRRGREPGRPEILNNRTARGTR